MISTKMPCDIYPKHIQYRQRMPLRISAFAPKRFPQDQILAAHLDDEVLPTWTTFLHHNTAQIEQWLKRWKLRGILLEYWQSSLQELWEHHAVREHLYSQRHINKHVDVFKGLLLLLQIISQHL